MCKRYVTYLKSVMGFIFLLLSISLQSQMIEAPEIDIVDAACSSVSDNDFDVFFNFSGAAFPDENNFTVQLSDANGDFTNPTNIGFINGNSFVNSQFTNVQAIVQFPEDTAGDAYRIQIISSTTPIITSAPSLPFQAYFEPNVALTLNNNENAVLCNNEPVVISLNELANINLDDFTYAWFKDGILIEGENESSLRVTEEGDYFATFNLGVFCTMSARTSNRVEVSGLNVDDVFIEGLNNVMFCADESYDLIASVEDNNYTYNWFKDDVLLASGFIPIFNTGTTDQFGTYRLELDTGVGCKTSSQDVVLAQQEGAGFEITLNSDLTRVLLPSETIELEVFVEPLTADLTYRWFKNGIELGGNTQSQINIVDNGEYFVEVTDNSSTCAVSLTSEVYTFLDATELVPVVIALGYEECNSLNANLTTVGVRALATDGMEYELTAEQLELDSLAYQWFMDNVEIPDRNLDNLEVLSYLENGIYHLNVAIGGGVNQVTGNSNDLNIFLSPGTEIISSSVSNTLCPGGTINLSIDELDGYTYTWFKDDVALVVTDVSSVDVGEIGVYYVVYEGFDCSIETERVEIIEFDEDVLEVEPSTTAVLAAGETITLVASGVDRYEWINAEGITLSTNETLDVNITGVYTLIGAVGDCEVQKEIEVVPDDGSVVIPNIITPFNADGINDTWQIPNRFAFNSNTQVVIYNSKGNEVLNTFDYQNDWPVNNNLRSGLIFYFKVIQEENLIKAGTISVLE